MITVLYVLTIAAVLCISSLQGIPCYWTADGKMRKTEYSVCAITVDYTPDSCVRHKGYFELWGSSSGKPGRCSAEKKDNFYRITCYCDTSAYCGGTPAPFEDVTQAHVKPPSKPYLSAEAKKYLHWAIGRNLIFFLVIAILIGASGYFYYGKDPPDLSELMKKKNSKKK
ncbi:hypothetical protein Aduo_016640 [Ancylostoma duodenale]